MESNTLLPGDQVRRKKASVAGASASDADAVARAAAALAQAGGGSCVENTWRIQAAALPDVAAVARADEHGGGRGGGHHQLQHQDLLSSEAFSLLHDIVSVDAAGTGGGGSASAHMSNASSLAPSVSNSREQSPDRSGDGLAMFFAKPAAAAVPRLACPMPLGSWVSPSAVSSGRPCVSIAHLPMLAAWTDA